MRRGPKFSYEKNSEIRKRVVEIRIGISTKLIFMVTTIVLTAVMVIVTIATHEFREDSLTRVQESNTDYADTLATQTFAVFKNVTEKMSLLAETAGQSGNFKEATPSDVLWGLFRQNDEMVSFGIYELSLDGKNFQEKLFITKDEFLAEVGKTLDDLKVKPQPELEKRALASPEDVVVINPSPLLSTPLLTVGFLTHENANKKRYLVRSDLRQDPLLKAFGKRKLMEGFLVDHDGRLLVHKNMNLVLKASDFSNLAIVQKLKERKLNNQQMEYQNLEGTPMIGAFRNIGVGGLSVVAQSSKAVALATVDRVQRRAVLVTVIVVCLAFILNFVFSKSMTRPLANLVEATEKVSKGVFDIKLQAKGHDEIGSLTRAFQKMTVGLQERDKLKTTFSKFHSQEIANKILSGSVKLGGERKTATVFFSDIRGFTSMSEQMSPDQVVAMLNEYMTEMVRVITKWKGVVDKYVGDAIMALWGVPQGSSEDIHNAVMAALEMRVVLSRLNERRSKRGQPVIKIGIGLHTGPVLAGNIGSETRLEYTVIGDTVNQASRIESATKSVGTDFLISEETYEHVKKDVVVGPPLSIHVKGKQQDLIVYQVIGHKDRSGNLHTSLSKEQQNAILAKTSVESEAEHQPPSEVASSSAHPPPYAPTVERRKNAAPLPITAPLPGEETRATANPEEWYISNGDEKTHGPYTLEQLREALQAGHITPTTYVWRQGQDAWIYIHEVPGFDRRVG